MIRPSSRYNYDPERARQLLDEAGWKDSDGDGVRDRDGVKLAFVLLGNDQELIGALSQAWAEIGVQVTPQTVSLPGLTQDFLTPRTFDAALVHWDLPGRSRSVSPLARDADHGRAELCRLG